jgi:hypothetical protein
MENRKLAYLLGKQAAGQLTKKALFDWVANMFRNPEQKFAKTLEKARETASHSTFKIHRTQVGQLAKQMDEMTDKLNDLLKQREKVRKNPLTAPEDLEYLEKEINEHYDKFKNLHKQIETYKEKANLPFGLSREIKSAPSPTPPPTTPPSAPPPSAPPPSAPPPSAPPPSPANRRTLGQLFAASAPVSTLSLGLLSRKRNRNQ